MKEQLIISMGREFGSGGHIIAIKLAARFSLPIYDYNLLTEVAGETNLDAKKIEKYDEIPRNFFNSRTVRGFSNSPEETVANMQFDFIRKKAAEGESFVVVGRCAEEILREYPGLVSIFVLADMDWKIERIAEYEKISYAEAEAMIKKYNKKRKAYHNYYCQWKWGDSRNYDISINSSKLGIDETTDMLEAYIKSRIKHL